ncbi:MAG: NAD-binding protein [Nodosilinea sp.]
MYLIVIGAEAEGQQLVEIAVNQSYEVTLITEDEDSARRVLKKSDIRVLLGTIADDGILEEAEAERADAIVAATHDDAQNLMAMVLAQTYNIKDRVSLVNQTSHSSIFESLGARVVSDPASIIARQLYDYLT